MSLSKKIKYKVKQAVSWVNDFEQTAAELAIEKKYDYVICGHIHQPQKRIIETKNGKVTYLNSGDWVENLTALEFNNNEWTIYHYNDLQFEPDYIQSFNVRPILNVVTSEVGLSLKVNQVKITS